MAVDANKIREVRDHLQNLKVRETDQVDARLNAQWSSAELASLIALTINAAPPGLSRISAQAWVLQNNLLLLHLMRAAMVIGYCQAIDDLLTEKIVV